MASVYALIPAHNEAPTIAAVVAATRPLVDRVIVVDDGSQDGTADRVATEPGVIEVLRLPENRGKANALWTGMQYALEQGADAIVTLDADGQHDASEIPNLIAAWRAHPHHLVIGARLKGRETTPPLRLFGNRTADFWIGWASGQPLRDSQSGFRLYPAGLLRRLELPHGERRSFVFESEALIEAERLGFPVTLVPVRCIYPDQHRASHFRAATDTLRIIQMVALRLLARGLHPLGLLRHLGLLRRP
ncbi:MULTISPECIES: glycosyltransferase family 2 protein [unclassified Thioalkalivibrio]|uniref:glycosyltransferase family 2 protein n=1 Tax=unclassified Thioalkalivibrio TaxID=2621013 RepID=UPI0003668EDB|nr:MULTISPECIES: glycosyltransferase family 2 protein [unclassified Thioalkalivibrio]